MNSFGLWDEFYKVDSWHTRIQQADEKVAAAERAYHEALVENVDSQLVLRRYEDLNKAKDRVHELHEERRDSVSEYFDPESDYWP